MSHVETLADELGLVSAFLEMERFWPTEPQTLKETGLNDALVESLICKRLASEGTASGRSIAKSICLPFGLLEEFFVKLRTHQIIVHAGSAPFNDYHYSLTEQGRARAEAYRKSSSYIGPAPVVLRDYVNSVAAQSLVEDDEAPTSEHLAVACRDISVDERLLDMIGPALNSGSAVFLYGAPGNGKSTLAKRITKCFGSDIWIPYSVAVDGHIIKLYDPAVHTLVEQQQTSRLLSQEYDRRWLRVQRPTVIVGGELTMENLEIRHDHINNVSEAPIQMKSNGGCLLIDDFGRQRATPAELLNRWIVPLESRLDFLTLPTGKKIEVPFEQLIIFSTNIQPRELVDEAFLRRIPYKIEITDPTLQEIYHLFQLTAQRLGVEYCKAAVDHLIAKFYQVRDQPMRRCHPRDLMQQVKNYCRYRKMPLEMKPEYFDIVASTYFAEVFNVSVKELTDAPR